MNIKLKTLSTDKKTNSLICRPGKAMRTAETSAAADGGQDAGFSENGKAAGSGNEKESIFL